MAASECDTVETELVGCKSIDSRRRTGAKSLFALLDRAGFEFADAATGIADVESEIDKDGDVIGLVDVTHRLLAPEDDSDSTLKRGSATISYLHELRRFSLGQGAAFDTLRELNKLAKNQCDVVRALYSVLKPEYGWIDDSADEALPLKALVGRKITYIFWANFYGPEYVKEYGKDLFLKAPGWSKEQLPDGGVLYITCKTIAEWTKNKPQQITDYFRKKGLKVRPFGAKYGNRAGE